MASDFYGVSGVLWNGYPEAEESNLANIDESNYRVLTRSDVVAQGADTDGMEDTWRLTPMGKRSEKPWRIIRLRSEEYFNGGIVKYWVLMQKCWGIWTRR
jgi:hypothetical protein